MYDHELLGGDGRDRRLRRGRRHALAVHVHLPGRLDERLGRHCMVLLVPPKLRFLIAQNLEALEALLPTAER